MNELLHEIYPNHDDDTYDKWKNNKKALKTSIKSMITDLIKLKWNMKEYMSNYDLWTFVDNVERLNYTHSALIYIHINS